MKIENPHNKTNKQKPKKSTGKNERTNKHKNKETKNNKKRKNANSGAMEFQS
jgi:hypothetical protein